MRGSRRGSTIFMARCKPVPLLSIEVHRKNPKGELDLRVTLGPAVLGLGILLVFGSINAGWVSVPLKWLLHLLR